MDEAMPVEWGVTHSSDYPIWFFGNGKSLEDGEKSLIKDAFVGPLGRFVMGYEEFGWGTSGAKMVRVLKSDGDVEIREDGALDEGVKVWKRLRDADTGKVARL
jgi:hypothetical protein